MGAGYAVAWNVLRIVVAVAILAAVAAQGATTIDNAVEAGRDVATTTVNFFSFFTILSNIAAAFVLIWAAMRFFAGGRRRRPDSRSLALALASVSTYMIVTGIVYNLLLRTIELPQGATVPWSNETLHVVAPIFLLADVIFAPSRRRLRWRSTAAILVFPVVWVIYTLIRGPLVTNPTIGKGWWYPYPFLDPHSSATGGYGGVTLYIVGIASAMYGIATLVVWAGRRRGSVTTGDTAKETCQHGVMSLSLITESPAGTLEFHAAGTVTADDYRAILDPAIEAAAARGDKVNLVYVLGEDFDRYSLGAMWQDLKLEGMPHDTWGRVALVTEHSALAEAVHLLAFLFPGELKIYSLAQHDDAVRWASGQQV